ncbi:MAG: cation:proton antiporter, partial [Mobilitalea sp.]
YVSRYKKDMRRFVIVAFFFCLALSFYAEKLFGVADITGAFTAGLIISNISRANYISSRFDTISYMYLSPVFFASIGLKVVLPHMTTSLVIFSVLLLLVAILTKVIGCGIGAKISRYSNREAVQVGCGMISRGEVALIVASKGSSLGLMSATFFGPIIVTVIITTIISPILLKFAFHHKVEMVEEVVTNSLIEDYKDLDTYNESK